ncbi:hypothetical protein AAZX31_04G103000 [Glycine max]
MDPDQGSSKAWKANIFQGCADAVKLEAYADAVRFSSLIIRHMEILHSRIVSNLL